MYTYLIYIYTYICIYYIHINVYIHQKLRTRYRERVASPGIPPRIPQDPLG